jgi:hypothetical protein
MAKRHFAIRELDFPREPANAEEDIPQTKKVLAQDPTAKLLKNGAPGTIRTSDPQIRSLMLYPAELRALGSGVSRSGFAGAQAHCADCLRLIDQLS